MTRDQIEAILKSSGAKSDKDGFSLPEGSSVTLHVAHDGASLAFQKLENVKFDGELIYGKNPKQTIAIVTSDVFAVALEGGNDKARRPAGFAAV
ncbi:MAG: hypothetical protein KIT84_23815 [Labilithrix sp.]|nr:hypothetical protein [Labilithrix sp.]MCW5814076.1 hypothetical protein [Labilithrix sp.]